MKPSGVKFIENRWPLIDKFMKVKDCERWLRRHGYPVFWSSACVYCPFISNAQRQRIKDHDPAGHEKACRIDEDLRSPENTARFRGRVYVHKSRKPLREADFSLPELPLFGNECEGMCGV